MDYFKLAFTLSPGMTSSQKDAFWDAFVAEVARHGLVIGGGGANECACIISSGANSRVTVRHRAVVTDWLNSTTGVSQVFAGPFQKDADEVAPGSFNSTPAF